MQRNAGVILEGGTIHFTYCVTECNLMVCKRLIGIRGVSNPQLTESGMKFVLAQRERRWGESIECNVFNLIFSNMVMLLLTM